MNYKILYILPLFPLILFFNSFTNQKKQKPVSNENIYNTLYQEYLYKPDASQFVSILYDMPACWGSCVTKQLYGWKKPNDSLIYLIDKQFYLYPSECIYVHDTSFVDFVKNNYTTVQKEDEDGIPRRISSYSRESTPIHPIIIAAWTHSIGNKELSKKVFDTWEKSNKSVTVDSSLQMWKNHMEWTAFAGLIHHYMIRKDKIAERHGLQIKTLYPNVINDYYQSEALIKEIERKKQAGKYNVKPDSIPADYHKWQWKQKAEFLISRLDEIDQRQWGQPGGVSLAEDWRIKHIVQIGDSIVPMLIDVIEKDKRFTRSVHFWRDFSRSRTLLNVKEAALTAIMCIWQDPLFEPAATGDNFTSRGDSLAHQLVAQLRFQLKGYNGKTLDKRKVEILLDRTKESADRRTAASLLANYGSEVSYGTMVWTSRMDGKKENTNPLIEKWKNPSIAEMIWNEFQYDIQLINHDISDVTTNDDYENIIVDYLYSLIDLGDKTIVPTLKNAYKNATDVMLKRNLAYACYWLGDKETWGKYCGELQKGEIKLPPISYTNVNVSYGNPAVQPGNRELRGIISYLQSVKDTSSTETLNKITSQGHPYYHWIELRILQLTGGYDSDYNDDDVYYNSTWCIEILKRNLDNKKDSDISLKFYPGSGITAEMDWSGQSSVPMHKLWDTSEFEPKKEHSMRARICDMASLKLYHLIFGIPVSHVHLKDKDKRIEQQKAFLNKYTKLREITSDEYNTINELYNGTRYVPDLPKLDHAATQDDVNAGKAIFYMQGNKVANVSLPAWGIHKNDIGKKVSLKYLLVQAEYNSKGELIYGAFTEDGPKIIAASELTDIKKY